jgi:hypothetical protein
MPGLTYVFEVLGAQMWDPLDDNLDVQVTFSDGSRHAATFFTIRNIQALFAKNRRTGECERGLYLWAVDMILVEELTMDVIGRTIASLLTEGEFTTAFRRLE